jgi:hypothetical protein
MDVSIGNITVNMFPPSLETLCVHLRRCSLLTFSASHTLLNSCSVPHRIVQRAKLEKFDPRGNRTFTSVSYLYVPHCVDVTWDEHL